MLKVGAKRRRTRQQIHEDGLAAQVQAHLAEQLQAQKNELEAQLIAQQQQNEAANQEANILRKMMSEGYVVRDNKGVYTLNA